MKTVFNKIMTKKIKLLIVEDNVSLKKVMNHRLKEEGYGVDIVGNGNEALKAIEKKDYTLVLLDLIMPFKNGYEVLQTLKTLKKRPRVIVFTNLAGKEERQKAIDLGAEEVYIKADISIQEVVNIVKNALTVEES